MRQAIFLFACALACQPAQSATPRPQGIPLPTLAVEEHGDPICGSAHKWDGSRCTRVAGASSSTPTTTGSGGKTPSFANLQVVDLTVGTGPEVHTGDVITVHYTGALQDGTVFDASRPRGKPFQFRVGANQVIKGFDRGVVGMKVGGSRRLTIPPELGYGNKAMPQAGIPAKATLIFEVELVAIGAGE